jgi:hypothetical protein
VARLLGIRLLALDAKLVVAPAEVQGRTRPTADSAVAPPARVRAIGAGLTAAERSLAEGTLSLAVARGTASDANPARRVRGRVGA